MTWLKAMLGMVLAEMTKLRRRGFATAGLIIALVHGLLCFLIMFGVHAAQRWGPIRGDGPALDVFDGVQSGEWALFSLYLPVMGVVLMAVVGELFAGEYAQRTYSMLLIRPVPRWQIYLSKFIASYGYVLFVLAVAALVAMVLGLAAFGTDRDMAAPGAEVAAGLGSDQSFGLRLGDLAVKFLCIAYSLLPIVAITAFLAVVTRSTALTVTYTIILLVIDGGVWLTFPWVTQALEYEVFADIKPYTLMANRAFMFPWFFQGTEQTVGEFINESWKAIGLIAGYSALFVAAAIGIFTVQDVE